MKFAVPLCVTILSILASQVSARPSLIGDSVRMFRSVDGINPASGFSNWDETAIVTAGQPEFDVSLGRTPGGPELVFGTLSMEADTIRFNTNQRGVVFGSPQLSFNGYLLTDLNWIGEPERRLTGVEVINSDGPLPDFSVLADTLKIDYLLKRVNQEVPFIPGRDFFEIRLLTTTHAVPEPTSFIVWGLLGAFTVVATRSQVRSCRGNVG